MCSNVLKSLQEVSFPCIFGDIFRLFLNWRILVKMWRTSFIEYCGSQIMKMVIRY